MEQYRTVSKSGYRRRSFTSVRKMMLRIPSSQGWKHVAQITPFHPYSPYAVAKQYGFWMVKEYRDAYGMFAVNGILFNHESERRGENFVTRKITLAAGRIAEGLQDHLELGNMDSLRDWGYAKDYVECMWLIMQQEKPDDFVIATGVQHTVRDFTEKAFAANGITIRWEGTGIEEKGYDAATGKMLVCVNPQWFRPTDVDNLWGDPTKAKAEMRRAIADGTVMKYLQKVPIHKDDLFFIQAGTVHAIGAGALVAEIQENSNLTYRLYDYDRVGKDGKKRELHIDKALDVANLKSSAEPRQPLRVLKYRQGVASELLTRCKYFEVYRMIVNTERRQKVHYRADGIAFRVLLCVNGCGTISYDGGSITFYKGDCIFVPADSEILTLHGQAQFLDVRG